MSWSWTSITFTVHSLSRGPAMAHPTPGPERDTVLRGQFCRSSSRSLRLAAFILLAALPLLPGSAEAEEISACRSLSHQRPAFHGGGGAVLPETPDDDAPVPERRDR